MLFYFEIKQQETIMSELQLRQDVLDELEFEPSVNAAHIGVAVEKDVVVLAAMCQLAEKLAR